MSKQFLISGYGYIDEKIENEQWLIPGYGYIDEETAIVNITSGKIFKGIGRRKIFKAQARRKIFKAI